LVSEPSSSRERLLSLIAELTKLSSIKDFIRKKKYLEPLITEFETSNSFNVAGYNAEIMLNLATLFDKQQVIRIVEASLSNPQIHYSWKARTKLEKFLAIHKDKIPLEKLKKLYTKLRE